MEYPPINPLVTPLPPSPKKRWRWIISLVVLSFVILGIRWKSRSTIIDMPQGHETITDNDTPKGYNAAEVEQRAKDYAQWQAERRKTGTSVTLSLLQNGTYASATDGQPITLKDGTVTYRCTVPGNPDKQTCEDRLGATFITDLDYDGLDDGVAAIRESTDNINWIPLTFVMLGTLQDAPKAIRQPNIPDFSHPNYTTATSIDDIQTDKGYIIDSIAHDVINSGIILFVTKFWSKTDSPDTPSQSSTHQYIWKEQSFVVPPPDGPPPGPTF